MTIVRVVTFAAALVSASYSFRWESDQILPWRIRVGGMAVGVLIMAAAAWRWPAGTVRKLVEWAQSRAATMAGGLALVSFAIAAALAFWVLEPFPHIPDGFSYYLQAKIFASGRLFAAAPALPQFFEYEWVAVHDGRWFSIFPPGWPLVLSVGVRLGGPAFVNPVLAAACVVAVFALGSTLYGRLHGVMAALLCCLSPFFLFMSAEFMSHTATLLVTTLSTLWYVKALTRDRGLARFGLAGLFAGIAFLIRPVDAVAIWVGQTAYGMLSARSRRVMIGSLASGATLACGIASYLLYNRALVGRWFVSPLALLSATNRMGFGPDIGEYWTPFGTLGHTPWRALLNLNHNLAVMSQDLFGWPISSLVFVMLLAVFGRKEPRHWLSFGVIAAMVIAYALYWYHGVAFGARFYFALLPHLVMLTVEGVRQTPDIVSRVVPQARGQGRSEGLSNLTLAAVSAGFAFGWTVYVPKVALVAPYHNQRGMNAGFYDYHRRERPVNALVFVQVPRVFYYGPAYIANDLPIGTGNVIYALDRGVANQRLMALFPGRSVHRYTYRPEADTAPRWLPAFIRDAGPSR
jgi:hypothetical protein